jgi:hypothetical protein
MKTCGEVLVEILENYGIDTVFGIPGVHTVELYRGLPKTKIRHITPRHEQGAGFMADGYARAGGRPAACFIISGPGMTNIVTAMGQAYADSIPMLVISSVNNTHELGWAWAKGACTSCPTSGRWRVGSRSSATACSGRPSCPRCWPAPSRSSIAPGPGRCISSCRST